MLACIALSFSIWGKDGSNYDVSFTVAYDELVRKIYGDRIVKLNSVVRIGDYKKLARLISVKENQAKAIVRVRGKNILGEDLDKDMNTDKIPFIVHLRLNDTTAMAEIQDGIVSFLEEGNTYLASRKAIKIREIDNELAFIDEQLHMMDSVKRQYSKFTPSNNEKGSPGELYEFSYELYKKRQDLLRKKEMPSNLQVIDDAIAPKIAGKSPVIVIGVGVIVGLILYLFTVGILLPVFRKEP